MIQHSSFTRQTTPKIQQHKTLCWKIKSQQDNLYLSNQKNLNQQHFCSRIAKVFEDHRKPTVMTENHNNTQ